MTKSTVPVGTAEKVRAAVRSETGAAVRGLLESRVSQGRRRDRGFHEARPRRHRHRRRRGEGGDGRAVRALHPPGRQPDPVHGHRVGRGHQVRRQRDARHPHLVHEPDGPLLRAGRRRRAQRPTRHRVGPADRPRVPLPGPRLRRLLLSEGREGDHPHRRLARVVARRAEGGGGRERGAEARRASEDARPARHGSERQDRRHLGPRLQGRDRRHAREPDHPAHRGTARRPALACRRTTPRPPTRPAPSSATA